MMTLLIIALATIIVAELTHTGQLDQRAYRSLSESIQADYGLKSALNFSLRILELPNIPGKGQGTWQGEWWAQVASLPNLPIEGVNGEMRLLIADEYGKFPLNAVAQGATTNTRNPQSPTPVPPIPGTNPAVTKWRESLRDLFLDLGFKQEKAETGKGRTPGDILFGAADQVAVIADWIDSDHEALNDPNFDGEGAEGRKLDRSLFPGRPLRRLSDLLLVPGMTLERLSRVAPYVNVVPNTSSQAKININTAPAETLVALKIRADQVADILRLRTDNPVEQQLVTEMEEAYPELKGKLTNQSQRFSIYGRVVMPSVTRWLRAEVGVASAGGGGRRVIQKNSLAIEFY